MINLFKSVMKSVLMTTLVCLSLIACNQITPATKIAQPTIPSMKSNPTSPPTTPITKTELERQAQLIKTAQQSCQSIQAQIITTETSFITSIDLPWEPSVCEKTQLTSLIKDLTGSTWLVQNWHAELPFSVACDKTCEAQNPNQQNPTRKLIYIHEEPADPIQVYLLENRGEGFHSYHQVQFNNGKWFLFDDLGLKRIGDSGETFDIGKDIHFILNWTNTQEREMSASW